MPVLYQLHVSSLMLAISLFSQWFSFRGATQKSLNQSMPDREHVRYYDTILVSSHLGITRRGYKIKWHWEGHARVRMGWLSGAGIGIGHFESSRLPWQQIYDLGGRSSVLKKKAYAPPMPCLCPAYAPPMPRLCPAYAPPMPSPRSANSRPVPLNFC